MKQRIKKKQHKKENTTGRTQGKTTEDKRGNVMKPVNKERGKGKETLKQKCTINKHENTIEDNEEMKTGENDKQERRKCNEMNKQRSEKETEVKMEKKKITERA